MLIPTFLSLFFLLESTALPSHRQERSVDVVDGYCLSPGCVKAAAALINTIDETVDPCSDFYDFACGGFLKETVIPDHKTSEGAFSLVRDKLNERLRKLFESKSARGEQTEPKIFDSVRSLYKSCMDEDHIEESSLEDAKDILSRLGGWPVLLEDKWEAGNFTWYGLAEKANLIGFDTSRILSASISTDDQNSTRRLFELDQPSLGMDREYLVNGIEDKEVQAYYKYMVDTAVYFGANKERAEAEMKEVLEFELKIANITRPKEERRNKTALYNPMTIAEASKLWPGINWVDHIAKLLEDPKFNIDENEIINVATPGYMLDAAALIPTVPTRTQANYMMWRYVKGLMSYLDKRAKAIQLDYERVLTGKKTQSPRWELCVKSTSGNDGTYLYFLDGSLTNAIGAMYAKRYFPYEKKQVADEMVEKIREEFKIMLEELDWMDPETKAKALKKADQITPHVGYAREILDDNLIDEFYQGLELNSKSYLKNFLSLKKFINDYYTKEFRNPVDKHSWKTHGGAAIVNAFYSSTENSIQFPAGILDGLFFQADRPLYMNYGAIGLVVGHEITHGFDDQGSQKDGEGNLVNWWQPDTKQKYLEKAKCIVDQYSNYSVEVDGETLNLNGINTQGENIADNGGVKEALRAYQRLMEAKGEEEPRLPGLKYTPRQLFWMSTAAVWCTAMRPAQEKNQILTDPHAPGRFRVNGPFSNMPEFAADWNCPLGSPMNPPEKCVVW